MSTISPMELIDKCVGQKLWIMMRDDKELAGTMRGYDDYFNIVLDDVTTMEVSEGEKKLNKIDSMLVNGSHITIMVPGGELQ